MVCDSNDHKFIFVIDGEKSSKDKNKNPLNVFTRIKLFEELYPSVTIDCASSVVNCFDILDVMGFTDLTLYCGGDRKSSYISLINSYFSRCDIICQDRNDNVSATLIRKLIRDNNLSEARKYLHSRLNDIQIKSIEKEILCPQM